MTNELNDTRVAFLVANEGIEEIELLEPWQAVINAGGQTRTGGAPAGAGARPCDHLDRADRFPVDLTTEEAQADDFDAVILPGGVANPDQLRQDAAAVDFIMAMFEAGQAAGRHLPRALDPHRGRPGLRPHGDLVAQPADRPAQRRRHLGRQEVAVCRDGINTLVTSRKPDDLTAFCAAFTKAFAEAKASVAA